MENPQVTDPVIPDNVEIMIEDEKSLQEDEEDVEMKEHMGSSENHPIDLMESDD